TSMNIWIRITQTSERQRMPLTRTCANTLSKQTVTKRNSTIAQTQNDSIRRRAIGSRGDSLNRAYSGQIAQKRFRRACTSRWEPELAGPDFRAGFHKVGTYK